MPKHRRLTTPHRHSLTRVRRTRRRARAAGLLLAVLAALFALAG